MATLLFLLEGQVVRACPAPVVLNLEDEAAPIGMVCVAGQANVIVGVELEVILDEALWCVAHAFVLELFGALAEVAVEHALQGAFPSLGIDLLCSALRDALQVGRHGREELAEVEERVAVFGDGIRHEPFGDEAIVLHAVDGVLERAALAEAGVAMGADVLVGAVNVGLADEERLAEVEVVLQGWILLDGFTLQESQRRVSPAGAAAVLVLDTGDGLFDDGGEDEAVVVGLLLLVLCGCRHNH